MAQQFILENDIQQTVNFSTVNDGDIFVYNNQICVKIDNNNPNYAALDIGEKGKLNDTDQVVLPSSVLLKLE
jgi:hypothetical protein